MSERQTGLRFDIYERIHLDGTLQAIDELRELELTPHIQMFREKDQAVLKGYLLLTGAYSAVEDEGRGEHPLRHDIPVEISLPLERIRKADELSVSIDNFDVDLLSSRSMNVTGVLSLDGIELLSGTGGGPGWKDDNREQVFIHQVPVDATGPEADLDEIEAVQPDDADVGSEETDSRGGTAALNVEADDAAGGHGADTGYETAEAAGQQDADTVRSAAMEGADSGAEATGVETAGVAGKDDEALPQTARPEQPAWSRPPEEPRQRGYAGSSERLGQRGESRAPETEPFAAVEPEEEEVSAEFTEAEETTGSGHAGVSEFTDMQEAAEPADPEADAWFDPPYGNDTFKPEEPPAKQQVKVAFASIKENPNVPAPAYGYDTDSDHDAESPDAAVDDALEWKKLFLSGQSDEHQFRKVKMCIIQKDETLSMIADRYQLNPREIMLYNRLDNEEVQAGQLIYIPKTG